MYWFIRYSTYCQTYAKQSNHIIIYIRVFSREYCRAVSLLKIEFSFPSRSHSGQGQEQGVQGLIPGIVLNFTSSRRRGTASPVLKTDSVDIVFTFYYARKMQPATIYE